jgi:hypothetical protein
MTEVISARDVSHLRALPSCSACRLRCLDRARNAQNPSGKRSNGPIPPAPLANAAAQLDTTPHDPRRRPSKVPGPVGYELLVHLDVTSVPAYSA